MAYRYPRSSSQLDHGLFPRIVEQPQDQRTVLGGTVIFRCKASGFRITCKWLHMRDGNISEVKVKPASAELIIEEVTEGHRGKYRCIVKNEFGDQESRPAELIIGKILDTDTLRRILNEEGIKDTDWPEIGECLGQNLRSTFIGGILIRIQECPSDETDLWHKIAQTLKGMETAAQIAIKNSDLEITRDRMDDVFREASKVNWHQVIVNFPSFNKSCLTEVLTKWLSQQKGKDPWIVWRKLAASVESLKEGSEDPKEIKHQLGIGYKLRLRFGVGLELNRDNLRKVLTTVGIQDWNIIVSGLKLDPYWAKKVAQQLASIHVFQRAGPVCAQILDKWPNPHSWEELARVINDSEDLRRGQQTGPEIAQTTRQLSGSGGFPIINYLYSDPNLKSKNVTSGTTVIFKCEARGAPPLKYNWMCDGDDLGLPDSWTVQLKITRGGLYNCRVENDFGSYISEYPLQLECDYPPTCKFDDHHIRNIQTGHKLNLHCTATGSMPLTYTWLHDGKELQEYNGPDLVIMQVKADVAGKYECHVANAVGNDTTSIKIEVGDAPMCKFDDQQNKNIQAGHKLNLHCTARGSTPLKYTWLHEGDELQECDGPDLVIMQVKPDDAGMYECRVANAFGNDATSIKIKVGDKPIIKAPPKIAGKVVSGEQVQLTCTVKGNGPYEYVWIHDNQTLVKEAGACWTEAELTIKQMTAVDQGEYKCRFINSFGSSESEPIPLHLVPLITEEPDSLKNVAPGKPAEFVVKANGTNLTYTWHCQNAKQLLPNDKRVVVGDARILKIDKVEPSDEGYYVCTICNTTGGSVETNPAQLTTIPQITEEPDSLENASQGKPAEFVVKTIGKNLTYTWHRQTAKQLLPNEKRVVVGNTRILHIDKVEPSDEGYYACTICNPTGGSVETNPAQLTTIPQITEEPDIVKNAVPGKPAEFVVKAVGKNLTYTWHHQTAKQLLPNEKRTVVGKTQILHIDKVEPNNEGYYVCTICNTTGGTVKTNPAQLTAIPQITEEPDIVENAVPGKPAEFVVKAVGKNLTYTWHRQTAKQLLPNEKRTVVGKTQILRIDKVEPNDEGYYVCTICNPTGGTVETNPAQLTAIPQITEEPDIVENAVPGKPAEFVVKAVGKNLTYTWHRQTAKQLLPNEKRTVVGKTQILRIDKVEPNDEGYYVCTICNTTGGTVKTNPAQLTAIPQITEEPDIVENAVPGKPAEFVVKAVGKNLTYTWHRQTAKQLLPNEKRTVVGKTQILRIDKVEPNDEGYYVCTICNTTGGTVKTNPAQLTAIPQITEEPDIVENAVPGKPAEFVVKAVGKNLTYTWHRQTAKQLLPNEKRTVVGKTQILRIDKVEPNDEGYYVCTICNTTGGTVKTNPAQLTAISQITEEPDIVENAVPGKPAEFVVKAVGKNLTYTWHRQTAKQLLPNEKRTVVGKTQILRIDKVEPNDEGYYVCTICNTTGGTVKTNPAQLTAIPQITAEPDIVENVAPGKPAEFVVKAVGKNLTYTWHRQTAKQLLPNEKRTVVGKTQILRIDKVEPNDEGYYICTICDPTGGSVETNPAQLTTIPQIAEEPDSLENLALGKPAEFVANAIGKQLTYTWHRQTTKQLLPNDKRVVVGKTRILHIDKVESSDEGYYVCIICNPTGGSVETNPAHLTTNNDAPPVSTGYRRIPGTSLCHVDLPEDVSEDVQIRLLKDVDPTIKANELVLTPVVSVSPQGLEFSPTKPAIIVLPKIIEPHGNHDLVPLCSVADPSQPPDWSEPTESNQCEMLADHIMLKTSTLGLFTVKARFPYPSSSLNIVPDSNQELTVDELKDFKLELPSRSVPPESAKKIKATIYYSDPQYSPESEVHSLASACVDIEPHGLQFAESIQVTLPIPDFAKIRKKVPDAELEFWQDTADENSDPSRQTWKRLDIAINIHLRENGYVATSQISQSGFIENRWNKPIAELGATTAYSKSQKKLKLIHGQIRAFMSCEDVREGFNCFGILAIVDRATDPQPIPEAYQNNPIAKKPLKLTLGKLSVLLKINGSGVLPDESVFAEDCQSRFEFLVKLSTNKPLTERCCFGQLHLQQNGQDSHYINLTKEVPMQDSKAMATELKTADEVAKSIGIPPAELDCQISDYHLSKISLFLGWQKIARHLGLSDINVKDIIKENPGDEDMRRWKTLTKWTGLYGTGATYRFLVEAHLTVQEINDAQEVCRLLRCTDAGHQTISKTPCAKDTWEYKTLYANQARLADQLADTPGIVNRLSYELYTREIISKAVLDRVDIRGPHVTEFMRVLPLLTAMLPKIRLNPENFHEFRAAMLMRSVGVNRDVVDRFMPEKEELESLKNAAPAVETNTARITTNISQTHEPNLSNVIDSLSSDDPTLVSNAACRLQHLALYGDDSMKSKIRQFGAIPVLVSHLQNSNTKELKLRIIQQCLQELVDNILVPCSGWSIEGASSPVVRPGLVQWKTELKNTTGIMRNMSSAGEPARVSVMRDSQGLVDSLLWMIKAAVQQKEGVDKKTVENSVCILRNLSYQLENEIDPQEGADDVLNHEWEKEQQRQMEELKQSSRKAPCCLAFLTWARAHNEPLVLSHSVSRPLNDVNFADPDLAALPICQKPVYGKALLWQPEVVYPYLALIEHYSSCADMLEAAAGAIQNLTACSWKWAVYSRNIICTSNGLPVIANLLNSGHDTVIKAAAIVLRNLTADAWNKAILGVNVIPLIITRLPFGSNHLGISEPTTIALLCTLMELCLYSPENAKLFQEKGGIPCLTRLTRSLRHTAKVTVAANKVCEILYEYRDCKSVLKREGWEIARYHRLEEENADQFEYSSMSHNDVSSRQKVSKEEKKETKRVKRSTGKTLHYIKLEEIPPEDVEEQHINEPEPDVLVDIERKQERKKGKKETKRVKRSTGKTLHYIKLEEIAPEDVEEQHSNEPEPDVLVDIERKQALKESQQQLEQKQQQHTATLESMESSV